MWSNFTNRAILNWHNFFSKIINPSSVFSGNSIGIGFKVCAKKCLILIVGQFRPSLLNFVRQTDRPKQIFWQYKNNKIF